MKNYKELQDKSAVLKASELIKEITIICKKYDFTGISMYENEKLFIRNCKDTIYT